MRCPSKRESEKQKTKLLSQEVKGRSGVCKTPVCACVSGSKLTHPYTVICTASAVEGVYYKPQKTHTHSHFEYIMSYVMPVH